MKQDEKELIAQILDGNEEAYGVLIDRYKEGLFRHCFGFVRDEDEAEDIAHGAFIEAFLHLASFDPRFRFSTWLYKIATNLALARLRKRRDVRMDEDELDRVISELPEAEDLAYFRELREAVDKLPTHYRTAIYMHYWQGKSYREIALHTGATLGTVKSWMSRAKKQLKEVLS